MELEIKYDIKDILGHSQMIDARKYITEDDFPNAKKESRN